MLLIDIHTVKLNIEAAKANVGVDLLHDSHTDCMSLASSGCGTCRAEPSPTGTETLSRWRKVYVAMGLRDCV